MAFKILILLLLGVIFSASGQDYRGGHRGPSTGVPSWCPTGSPRIFCLVNPCTVERCPAFPRAVCKNDNPCEPSCIGNFYLRGIRLSRDQCQRPGRY